MTGVVYMLFFLASGIVIPLALLAVSSNSLGWARYAALAAALLAVFFSLQI
jgi:hypothetical protein